MEKNSEKFLMGSESDLKKSQPSLQVSLSKEGEREEEETSPEVPLGASQKEDKEEGDETLSQVDSRVLQENEGMNGRKAGPLKLLKVPERGSERRSWEGRPEGDGLNGDGKDEVARKLIAQLISHKIGELLEGVCFPTNGPVSGEEADLRRAFNHLSLTEEEKAELRDRQIENPWSYRSKSGEEGSEERDESNPGKEGCED